MNRKTLLNISSVLLIVVAVFVHSSHGRYTDDDDYGYDRDGYGNDDDSYGSRYRKGYDDGGLDGYYDGGKRIIGREGKDPRRDGIDIGDYGPIFGRNDSMLARINLWITAADDWEQKGSGRYGSGRYGSGRYDSGKYDSGDYNSDKYDSDGYDSGKKNYKGGQRGKRSYSKITFPVKQVKNYKKFPFHQFPPLISIAPWLPIFYDKLTYQTFIFSITGGLYIIPPIINFYGQRFAVAQLIKWGYASLVSSGVPPPPAVNVAPLVQPGPPVVAGAPGAPAGKPAAGYKKDYAVQTEFPKFRPRPDYLQKAVNNPPSAQGPGPYSG